MFLHRALLLLLVPAAFGVWRLGVDDLEPYDAEEVGLATESTPVDAPVPVSEREAGLAVAPTTRVAAARPFARAVDSLEACAEPDPSDVVDEESEPDDEDVSAPRRVVIRDLADGSPVPDVEIESGPSPCFGHTAPWTARSATDGSFTAAANWSLYSLDVPDARFPFHCVLEGASGHESTLWVGRRWSVSGRVVASGADDDRDISSISIEASLGASEDRDAASSSDTGRRDALRRLIPTSRARPDEDGRYEIALPYAPGILLVTRGRDWRPTSRDVPLRDLAFPPTSLDIPVRPCVRVRGHALGFSGGTLENLTVTCEVTPAGADDPMAGVFGGGRWQRLRRIGDSRSKWTRPQSAGEYGSFRFDLPFDGDVTLFVKHEGVVVATENLGWSAGDRVDLAIRVIGK